MTDNFTFSPNIGIDIDGERIVFTRDKSGFISKQGIVIKVKDYKESGVLLIDGIECPANMEDNKEYILGAFVARWEELQRKKKDNLSSGLENDENDEDDEDASEENCNSKKDGQIVKPYDPQSIAVSPGKYSLREIVDMIDGDEDDVSTLDLSPYFQREYVWDSKRKSRLIESILLNIPLPVFYFSKDAEGRMQVVDGVQRLTTIHSYFHNKFALHQLEYLSDDCDGKFFKLDDPKRSLHPALFRALRKYQIDCNIIEPTTPEPVKLDIFKRLNTGGMVLNRQEIRHSFMKKDVRDFLKDMILAKEFRVATCESIKDTRMLAQEMVLRYIGFYIRQINPFIEVTYKVNMDEYLDDVAIALNECKKIPFEEIKRDFLSSMVKAHIMFDKQAFRKISINKEGSINSYRNPINKSLFVTFSIELNNYSIEEIRKRGNVVKEFAEFLSCNTDFYDLISHNTNHQLREAIKRIDAFLKRLYREQM